MSVREALQHYLLSVMQITGADATTLCFASELDRQTFYLFHTGNLPPLPELENEPQAADFYLKTTMRSGAESPAERPIVCFHPSNAKGGYLLGIDIYRMQILSATTATSSQQNRRSKTAADLGGDTEHGMIWLGLRYQEGSQPDFIVEYGGHLQKFTAETPAASDEWLPWTLALGGYMAWEAHRLSLLQQDSISQLPGRVEFQSCLRHEHDKAARENYPLGLILVNPDEFGLINHRLGQQTGDAALREVALRLSNNLRRSDQVFRYGGAVFVVVMPDTTLSAVNIVAEKLRQALTQHAYVNGAAHFSFSIGAAVCEVRTSAGEPAVDPDELLHRADQALNVAKLSGGARTVVWHPDGNHRSIGSLDRLSGIFTADTEKDYRNMLLLWDTITVISSWFETEAIAREFVNRVGSTFKPEQVALFINQGSEKLQLLAVNRVQSNNADRISNRQALSLSEDQQNLLTEAQQHKRTERLRFENGRTGEVSIGAKKTCVAYAIPLLARENCFGCLYIDGAEDKLRLDTSDLVFLDALAGQIGVALDRAALASRWKQEKELESQRLRQEVQELRQAMQHSRLVYQSDQMQEVLDTLHKVAPTDVTVMITGESGTGKEMLARTLHELSARQQKAFVTVDCGAIAHSLMDTELFGHIKGAYTGAQGSAPGRITQAEGGTLFLDEIGEIPLEIQAKLLRFLQEKEITPVGGTQPVSVDVRIVAATNRDLAAEVATGRFRGDLYYRLQVVTVVAPPLRERPDDILPLAWHFLERFSLDYGKNMLTLEQLAETALLEYAWPGNVRELQHRILQAVVMSDKDLIRWQELRLPKTTSTQVNVRSPRLEDQPLESSHAAGEPSTFAGTATDQDQSMDDPWVALRDALKRQVITVTATDSAPVPLGRWLAEDLVLTADQKVNNTARRASSALGMAETTFRRRLEKVKREYQAGLMVRNPNWSAIPPILTNLVTCNGVSVGEKLFERARSVLLEEVVAQVQQDSAKGSALMGVTTPTYRRWTSSLHS